MVNRSFLRFASISAAICLLAGCSESNDVKNTQNNNTTPSTSSACKNNEQRCMDNNVTVCENGSWMMKKACSKDQHCNPTEFTCDDDLKRVCNEGAVDCRDNVPIYCDQNAWHDKSACGSDETCEIRTGTCVKPHCTTGVSCEGNILVTCSESGQETKKNCGDLTCDENSGKCINPNEVADVGCTLEDGVTKLKDGESICSGGNLVTCDNGVPNSSECSGEDEICRDGEKTCSGLKPCAFYGSYLKTGEYGCNVEKNVVRCYDGLLKETLNCVNDNKVCMAVAGGGYGCMKPPADSCVSNGETVKVGDSVCEGNVLKTCQSSGTLDAGQDCKNNQDGKSLCQGNVCVPAPCDGHASGSKYCNDDSTKIVQCIDGKVSDVTPGQCTSNQTCQNSNPPVCVDKIVFDKIKKIHDAFDSITSINPKGCEKDDGKTNLTKVDVEIEGVVTALKNNTGFFIQDPDVKDAKNAGIHINCVPSGSGKNCNLNGFNTVKVGDNVKVVSKYVGYNHCQLWVRAKDNDFIEVTKTSSTKTITPVVVKIDQMNEGVHNDYNGSLVTLNDVTALGYVNKMWNIKDKDNDQTKATNYLKTITKSMDEGSQYNLTGIVYYNYNNDESNMAPTLISSLVCSGTEKKCENNIQYTCANGDWDSGKACTTQVSNALPVCAEDQINCSFKCKDGYSFTDGSCVKIEVPKKSCTDVENNEVQHGATGCMNEVDLGTCNDGSFNKLKSCVTDVANADPICKSGSCTFKCKSGFNLSEDKKSCIPPVIEYSDCKDAAGRTIMHGGSSCANDSQMGTCNDGHWENLTTCPNGCDKKEMACIHSPVTWCIFQHLESDGSAAYVRFAQPEGEDVSASFKCTLKSNNGDALYSWTKVSAVDATSGCDPATCGSNKEWKATSLPSASGTYSCVALVSVNGGETFVCPNYDIGGESALLMPYTDYSYANEKQMKDYTASGGSSAPVSGDTVVLAKWDFEDQDGLADEGIFKGVAKIGISSEGTVNDIGTFNTGWTGSTTGGKAAAASGWPDTLVYSTNKYWSMELNVQGYKDIKVSFDVYGSSNANKAIYLAYKLRGGNFAQAGSPLAFVDARFHSFGLTDLISTVNTADNSVIEIGIFPVVTDSAGGPSKTTNIRVDNIVVTGVKK